MAKRKRKAIPAKLRMQVFDRDNYTCRICGRSRLHHPELEIDVARLEVDHIEPHSKGGSDELDNLQTLCMQCNRGKGNNEELEPVFDK